MFLQDRDNYYDLARHEMLPFVLARRARVLEVGCGEGRFIGALTGVTERWGIEPSDAAVVAKGRLTRVLQATFDEAERELPSDYFDLVICNDVIEHLPNHSSFLRRIKAYIAPGGILIGSIPNVRFYNNMFEYLIEKDWYYREVVILDKSHLAFFTRKSLQRISVQHGFRVLSLTGINTNFRPTKSTRTWLYLISAYSIVGLTLGYFSDIRHLQFAFQATPARQSG